uniref:Uncharacterized protein n=1 Tax=Knipowitschia caucasica TaxID=637954 RepID=A0AAV2MGA9_KNICA
MCMSVCGSWHDTSGAKANFTHLGTPRLTSAHLDTLEHTSAHFSGAGAEDYGGHFVGAVFGARWECAQSSPSSVTAGTTTEGLPSAQPSSVVTSAPTVSVVVKPTASRSGGSSCL